VRGDLTTRRARSLALVACCIGAAAVPASGIGSSSSSLREKAHELTYENGVLASRSRASVLTLYALDSELTRTRARLASLQSEAAQLERQRALTRERLELARQTFAAAQRQLAERLRVLYEQGDSDALAVVLGAKSLDDALSGLETVDAAASTDRTVVAQTRASRAAYLSLQRKLAARAERLRRLQATVASSVKTLASARAERVTYLSRLAAQRRLNASEISSLEAQAQAIEARSQQIAMRQAAAPSTAAGAPPAVGAGGALTVTATAYTLQGPTATGAPAGYGVVAVDPSVIPLGTRMTIPGYGEGVAADTGGSIQGAVIDVWFPTAAAAAAWGRRTVTITLH
jgi:peptidoglycan DL-endopeptidase CwlO